MCHDRRFISTLAYSYAHLYQYNNKVKLIVQDEVNSTTPEIVKKNYFIFILYLLLIKIFVFTLYIHLFINIINCLFNILQQNEKAKTKKAKKVGR